ncbi:MAG TPA: ABC transporter permease [Pseudonocardiaceae bacterium]|nr:ABC transporter permease [Pseudonocardiaceae bacterium]
MSMTELAEATSPAGDGQPPTTKAVEGRSPWALAWDRLRHDKTAIVCAVFILLLLLVAIFAGVLSKLVGYGPTDADRSTNGITVDGLPVGPGGLHPLGTDELGRDILVRILYGTRVSLEVGISAAVAAVVLGVIIGLCAGYFGTVVDTLLARLMDVVLSFPFLLAAIALASVFHPSEFLEIVVISFFSFASVGRIVRGQTLSILEREYVEAARSLGASNLRIMFVDVLPNLIAPVIVYTTLLIPTSIVFESTLSFLGVGIPAPQPSWGNILSDSEQYYTVAWWYLVFPCVALVLTTLAFNLLGDSVRDALDPRSDRLLAARK